MSILILLFLNLMLKTDPVIITCGKYNIQLPLKDAYKKSEHRYTEGIFHDFVFHDLSSISVHCGSNVSLPLLGNKNKGDTILVDDQKIVRYTGEITYEDAREKGFFSEDHYLNSELTILIEYQSDSSVSCKYLNTLQVKK